MRSSAEILKLLQKKMFDHYDAYKAGKITQGEYLFKVRPIDRQIANIELYMLKYLNIENGAMAIPGICDEHHSSGHS
jgi:hypothetical protein